MKSLRPVPADFVEQIGAMTVEQAVARWKTSDNTVRRWMRETGATTRGCGKRPLPGNIDELAKGRNVTQLARLIGWKHAQLLNRLKKERPDLHARCVWEGQCSSARGLAKTQPPAPLEAPADFEAMCQHLTLTGLAKHYKRHPKTIRRWLDEASEQVREAVVRNATRGRANAGRNSLGRKAVRRKAIAVRRANAAKALSDTERPMSDTVLAMRWLQRLGPCYPMSVHLKALDDYMILGRRMSAKDVIAEAKRRGWRSDEKRLAA